MASKPVTGISDLYPAHIDSMCARYDDALARSGGRHAVIFSGALIYAFLDDQAYPFRANPHFLSWAPLPDLPLSYIVYTPGSRPLLVYFQPRDYWHPVPGAPEGYWTDSFDVRVVHDPGDTAAQLPANRDDCVLFGDIRDEAHAFGIERRNPDSAVHALHFARGVKTGYELACMRAASLRAARGHTAAAGAFADGRSEYEIHRAYCQAVDHTDNELPYDNIVALNAHGAVLHYTDLDRAPPATLNSFLIDAGAQVNGYAADITRTYSASDARFRELIARIDAVQQAIVSRVTAGLDYVQLHRDAHAMLGQALIDAGICRGDPEALIETGVMRAFFPHGLGHLLGLQVHDVGGFLADDRGTTVEPPPAHPFLRLTRRLEADMVLTIEPGIYVIDLLLDELRHTQGWRLIDADAVDWLRPFGGIRIEDDVRVLPDGAENLTREAFAATL